MVGFLPTEIYDFVYLTYILYHILMSLSTIIFENDGLFLDKTSFPMSYIFNKNNGRVCYKRIAFQYTDWDDDGDGEFSSGGRLMKISFKNLL